MIDYLKHLKLTPKGKCLIKTNHTLFGFVGNIIALKSMYNTDLVDSNMIQSIPTQSLQQDKLESLFSRIRAGNGFNNNPTCEQFSGNVRKDLINKLIIIELLR